MLDYEQLLAPISADSACGEDLSFSQEFTAIEDARYADDPTLEQGVWQTQLKKSDWPAVVEIGEGLLQERSKDLRIVAWLTEAHTQLEGFAGLAWGYRLASHLCDKFWDDLYPREEEDDDGILRIGHLQWLLTHSGQWVLNLPVTKTTKGHYSANDFKAAYQKTNAEDASRAERPTPDQVDAAWQATSFEFYNELSSILQDCLAALTELEKVLDKKIGEEGPSFRECRESLEHVADMVVRFIGVNNAALKGETEAAGENDADAAADSTAETPSGPINSRREALAQLRQVAMFFRRTEPHSPVAYLADKAAKWGEMPLHVWLRRVIKDEGSLSHVEELLDIGQEKSEDNG